MGDTTRERLLNEVEVLQRRIAELEERLKEGEELSRTLAENAVSGVALYKDKFIYVNRAMETITGYSRSELLGLQAWDIVHRDFRRKIKESVQRQLKGDMLPPVHNEIKIVTKHGEELWVLRHANTVHYRGEFAGLCTMLDITENKKMERALKAAATTDRLTGVFNRHEIEVILEREIERSSRYKSPLAVILFDVDHFKAVNDTYGHQVGDYVLKTMAGLVKEHIRSTDYLGRWGGEEFMLVVPGIELQNTRNMAEKLRSLIEEYCFIDVPRVTASMGVALFKESDTMDLLIKKADDALYKAKGSGRNIVCVSDR